LTPLIGTVLAHHFSGQWWPLAVFYSALAVVSLVCITRLDLRRQTQAEFSQDGLLFD